MRQPHAAFIPRPSPRLSALTALIGAFIAAVQVRSREKRATLDMDATLVETYKQAALYCLRLINLPGRVLERGRQVFVRLTGGHSSNEILFEARRRMPALCGSG